MSWYEHMQDEMDGAALKVYCEAIAKKIEAIDGVKLKDQRATITIDDNTKVTKKQVLEAFYQMVTSYSYPKEIAFDTDAITFFFKKEIVSGDANQLNLDKVCTLEEAAVLGTRLVRTFYHELHAGAKGLLWKIQKGDTTIYLLGSVHLASYDIYPFNQALTDAFDAADVLGCEIDASNAEGVNIVQAAMFYTDGTTLEDHLSPELYEQTVKAFEKYGMTEAVIKAYKPWGLANNLQVFNAGQTENNSEAQLMPALGIDNYFLDHAAVNQLPILELESYEAQAGIFDSFSPALQEYYLSSFVKETLSDKKINSSAEAINVWLELWEKGDVATFEKDFPKFTVDETLAADEKDVLDEFDNKLWTERDGKMTEKIESLLNNNDGKTYFIVLGVGHYIGKGGIVQNLKDKGYVVEQIK